MRRSNIRKTWEETLQIGILKNGSPYKKCAYDELYASFLS